MNCCHLELPPSGQEEKLPYAHSLYLPEAVLHNSEPFFSNDDFLRSSIINEAFSDSVTFYCRKVDDINFPDWANLLLRKRHLLKKRLVRLSLAGIFTTGPPQEDSDIYYSSWKFFYSFSRW